MSRTQNRARSRRAIALPAAAVLTAAGLVLAAPLAAQAHVGVSPDSASAGSSSVLTFAFSHGCDGSPTTGLVFEIPEGVSNVTPTIEAGWTIEVERAANEAVERVTYTADAPVADGLRATVDLGVRFSADVADTDVAFPVTQICETGETAWAEIAESGQSHDDLESPAPVVAVGAAVAQGDGHGHSHGADAAEGEHAGHDEDAAADASAESASDVLPIALGAGGLAVGLVALVASLVALRRRA